MLLRKQMQHLAQSLNILFWTPIPLKRYQITSGLDTDCDSGDIMLIVSLISSLISLVAIATEVVEI